MEQKSKMSSKKRAGITRMTKQLQSYLAENKMYEAQQMWKAVHMRLSAMSEHTEALQTATDAAFTLLATHKQGPLGGEIARLVVKSLENLGVDLREDSEETKQHVQTLLKLFHAFPAPADGRANDTSDESNAAKITFMEAALVWSKGHPELHAAMARWYVNIQRYDLAQVHWLRGECPEEHVASVRAWAAEGYDSERDLFVARTVLQYLCGKNLKNANAFYVAFLRGESNGSGLSDSPLIHFLQLLLRTVERDALPVFAALKVKYATSLSRDAKFARLLETIGEVYFGVPQEKNLLQTLLGN